MTTHSHGSLGPQPAAAAGSALCRPWLMDAFLGLQIQPKNPVLEPSDVPFSPAGPRGTSGWGLAEGAVHSAGGRAG